MAVRVSSGAGLRWLLDERYEATQTLGSDSIILDDYNIGITAAASLKRRF